MVDPLLLVARGGKELLLHIYCHVAKGHDLFSNVAELKEALL